MSPWLEKSRGWMGPARREATTPAAPEVPEAQVKVPVVVWLPVRCPFCDSRDCVVTKTSKEHPGHRYQKCRNCGQSFRSVERLRR